jgi:hypothetical protein
MSHRSIDLLPEPLRARSQAGLRAGRYAAVCVAVIALLIVLLTHSRLLLHRTKGRLVETEARANLVLACEAQVRELESALRTMNNTMQTYHRVAVPLEISRVLATVVNELPATATLDRLDLLVQSKPVAVGARSSGAPGGKKGSDPISPPAVSRVLVGEMQGFAATDREIAELVGRLEQIPPFESVTLDYTRSRQINQQSAREFRLSFKINLDARYDVADREPAPMPALDEVTLMSPRSGPGVPAIPGVGAAMSTGEVAHARE